MEDPANLENDNLKTFAVKYLGITDGRIGILSRKLPLKNVVE